MKQLRDEIVEMKQLRDETVEMKQLRDDLSKLETVINKVVAEMQKNRDKELKGQRCI